MAGSVSDNNAKIAAAGGQAGQLRLRVCDGADLEVLAALLQDAILPGTDMQYDAAANRFVMVVNRFCWESGPLVDVTNESGGPVFERSLCGVQFHNVTKVWQNGMPSDRKASLFNILTVTLDDVAGAGIEAAIFVDIVFSGGSALRLQTGTLEIVAEDIEMARPALVQPDHGDDQ